MIKQKKSPLGEHFAAACKDYLYLSDQHYPQKAILKLIGDRYALSAAERSVLYRGIFPGVESELRKQKLIEWTRLAESAIYIDGYNVLFTIGSYLNGDFVFTATDGWLRDASEIHGRKFRTVLLDKAMLLLADTLKEINPSGVEVYLDEPVSHSSELAQKMNALFGHYEIAGQAITLRAPDHQMKTLQDGIAATSDSAIISHSKIPVADLPMLVLSRHFSARFTHLNAFL